AASAQRASAVRVPPAAPMRGGPDETALVEAPEAATGAPPVLAWIGAGRAPGARCVIVRGRYGHVGFIVDPAPIRIRVVEVVPPQPAKLVDQASRVLELAEDLPPVELAPELTDLGELAGSSPADHYLFPCRAGGAGAGGAGAGGVRGGGARGRARRGGGPPRMPWSPTSMRSRRGPTGPSSGAPGPARSTTGSTTTRLRSWTCAPASWRDGSRPGERFRSSPSAAC